MAGLFARSMKSGVFSGGVAYLKLGDGPKTALLLLGGPGNTLPRGLGAIGFAQAMKRFTRDYSVFLVCRRSGLSEGTTTRDMAADYAALIRAEFDGHVDLLIGFSYGGLIAQHFCADFPEMARVMVIGGSAHRVSQEALRIDGTFARLIGEGRDRDAMAARAEAVFRTGLRRRLFQVFLWVFGPLFLGRLTAQQRRDTVIEGHAEATHDASEALARIRRPVLIVCGRDDFAFAVDDVKQMAAAMSGSQLHVYDCDHAAVIFHGSFPDDVERFEQSLPARA